MHNILQMLIFATKSKEKMQINPFIVAGRIPAEYFCDRVEESNLLLQHITNQVNTVLISPRRVGKTGLVNFCFERPELEEYITISIDILHTTSLREFTMELGSAVFQRIAKRSSKMMKTFTATLRSLSASFGFDSIQNTPTFDIKLGDITAPQYTLEEIFRCIEAADRRCIVVIDEFQQITNYPEKNVEALLRSHIQKMRNANFIFAGSQRHIMGEMFLSPQRPFYQSTAQLSLNPIALDIYTKFVQHHFRIAKKDITTEAIELVYNTFNGVTFYIQRIMHDAWATTSAQSICDVSLVTELIERLITENASRLREQLAFITEQQKELLYAICSEGTAERITSSAFIKRHRLKSASAVQSAIKRLLEYDIVTENERRYTLADPLMQLWLNHSTSLTAK